MVVMGKPPPAGFQGAIAAGIRCAINPIIAHRKASEQASEQAADQLRQGNIFTAF